MGDSIIKLSIQSDTEQIDTRKTAQNLILYNLTLHSYLVGVTKV